MTSTTTDEMTLITKRLDLIKQGDALRQQAKEVGQELRAFAVEGDAETVQAAQRAYDEALDTMKGTKGAIGKRKIALEELTHQQKNGDRSVTATNVRAVKDEIESLENYLVSDENALKRTERVLKPLITDQHLAHLAADIFETGTDDQVIIRRRTMNAPDVSPAIILSQSEATEDYGTLDAAGAVDVTMVGEPDIDWRAVQNAFDDLGCEGTISGTQVTFNRAWWPIPRLHEPSVRGIGSWMRTFEDAWYAQVAGAADAERLRQSGVTARMQSIWTGLFDRATTDVTPEEDGKAVASSTFHVAAQQDNGVCMGLASLEHELNQLVSIFRQETVGDVTEAGEIVSVNLGEIERRAGFAWDSRAVAWRMGGAVQPDFTAEETFTIEFTYEAAS